MNLPNSQIELIEPYGDASPIHAFLAKNPKGGQHHVCFEVEDIEAARIVTIPARRLGDPDEFGELCAFLASAHAGYITGQNFLIDGGAFPGAF